MIQQQQKDCFYNKCVQDFLFGFPRLVFNLPQLLISAANPFLLWIYDLLIPFHWHWKRSSTHIFPHVLIFVLETNYPFLVTGFIILLGLRPDPIQMPSPSFNSFDIMSNQQQSDYCCPDRLREELSKNPKSILLIDCRSQSDYSHSHIRMAINITMPSLMLKRLKRGNLNISSVIQNNEAKERFTKNSKSASVILYDACSTDLNTNPSSVINLLLKKLRQDGSKASFLLGGFSTFEERFPEYCQNLNNESHIMGLCNLRISEEPRFGDVDTLTTCSTGTTSPISCPFPVQVLPYLYLGSAKNSEDLSQLQKYGISYILNVTTNVPNTFENKKNFHYYQIPISDHWSQNLSGHFPDAIRFIDEARKNKKGVLVHCLAGISRSVTVTVAYLMGQEGMSLNQAYDHVKRCKPNISPNFTFMGQLLEFEKDLHGDKTVGVAGEGSNKDDSGDEILTSDSEKLSPTSSNCSPI